MTILSKSPWEESVRKFSLLLLKFAVLVVYFFVVEYLLMVEMNFGHAHKTRFWYLLGVFSKFSEKHPCHFYRGVLLPPGNSFSLGGPPILWLCCWIALLVSSRTCKG